MISFKDIFKSSFLENVNAVTLPDMAIALVLAFWWACSFSSSTKRPTAAFCTPVPLA